MGEMEGSGSLQETDQTADIHHAAPARVWLQQRIE